MLTKNDLQQIRGIVKEEVYSAIQEETPKIVQKELKPIKRKLDKLHKDVHSFIDFFDGRLTTVEREVKELQRN